MEFDTDRRRFLELAGTGTALSLAGCSALQGNSESQGTPGASTGSAAEGASGGTQKVVVATEADRQKLQKRQKEIQSALTSGNISQSEARKRYQTAQQKLRSEAITSFRERANSNQNLSVVGAVEQYGILLVSGTPAALVEALSFTAVSALLPQTTFQQAKMQAQQQRQQQTAQEGEATESEQTAEPEQVEAEEQTEEPEQTPEEENETTTASD